MASLGLSLCHCTMYKILLNYWQIFRSVNDESPVNTLRARIGYLISPEDWNLCAYQQQWTMMDSKVKHKK